MAGLEIVAPDTALLEGHELQLAVRAWDIERRPTIPPRVEWGSTDPAILTVNANGTARGVPGGGGGDVAVWASAGAGQGADSLTIHVAVHGEVKWRLGLGPMPVMGGPAEGPDGAIYVVTLDDHSGHLGRLHAIAPDGAPKWSLMLTEVRSNSPLIVPDGTVIVVGQYVWAVHADGTLRWSLTTRPAEPVRNLPSFHEGALGHDGTLYAAMAYDLFAFDAATGDTLWQGPRASDASWLLPPTISTDGRTVYIKNTGGPVHAFEAATGVIRWSAPDPAPGKPAYGVGAALGAGRLVVPTADRLQELDTSGTIVAVGLDNTGLGMSEPAVSPEGTLYVQVPHTYGLMAFRQPDIELWRVRGLRSRWTWYGGPALAEERVLYVAAIDGFYAVDVSASGARVRWRFPRDSAEQLVFVGAPLIGRDGTVYSFTSCTAGEESLPCSDELFAFWEDKPAEPDSPWPMWRHDARRSGQAHR